MVLLFSDGLDDDIEKLEQKADELRKEGIEHEGRVGKGCLLILYQISILALKFPGTQITLNFSPFPLCMHLTEQMSSENIFLPLLFFFMPYVYETILNTKSCFSRFTIDLLPKLSWKVLLASHYLILLLLQYQQK